MDRHNASLLERWVGALALLLLALGPFACALPDPIPLFDGMRSDTGVPTGFHDGNLDVSKPFADANRPDSPSQGGKDGLCPSTDARGDGLCHARDAGPDLVTDVRTTDGLKDVTFKDTKPKDVTKLKDVKPGG
jgi:hypothetical protein